MDIILCRVEIVPAERYTASIKNLLKGQDLLPILVPTIGTIGNPETRVE